MNPIITEKRKPTHVALLNGRKVKYGSKMHIQDVERSIADMVRRREACKRGSEARSTFSRAIHRLKSELRSAKPQLSEGSLPLVNSEIPGDMAKATVVHAFSSAGLDSLNFKLSSASTGISNSADISVERSDVLEFLDLEDEDELWDALKNHLKKSGVAFEIDEAKSLFVLVSELFDESGHQSNAYDDKGQLKADMPGFVKLTIHVGDPKWAKMGASSHVGTPKWKTFFDILKNRADPTGKIGSSRAVSILFGHGIELADVDTFEKLVSTFYSDRFTFPNDREELWSEFESESKHLT